jgi:HPt (histidine-containing phosphotransfer) domain-containing protein
VENVSSSITKVLNYRTIEILVEDIGQATVEVVIKKSIVDMKRQFSDVAIAARLEDWQAVRNAVHSISGISAMVGAEKLSSIAREVEKNCIELDFAKASDGIVDVLLATLEVFDQFEKLPTHNFSPKEDLRKVS